MPTLIPFHRAVLDDPAFVPEDDATPFAIHTRWIETEFSAEIPPYDGTAEPAENDERRRMTVEVAGRRLEVVLPDGIAGSAPGRSGGGKRPPSARRATSGAGAATGDALTAPMQGTIVKVAVADDDQVAAGDLVVVLEAMKMEQPITAHKAGTVRGLSAQVGSTVQPGATICEITEA
jgi:acetyl-CoA/propionyl-CoA carboxylase, biotin carboxylase, biotin carboxyl carrier protein